MSQVTTKFIAEDAVTNARLAEMATLTIKGNSTGGTANPSDLSVATVTSMLSPFVGDSGSGGTKGLVPAPSAGDAAANKVLGADGTWVTQGGASELVGEIRIYGGATAPTGWLLCNTATPISRTTYAALFAVLGATYGAGDGSTTFNIPNMAGVFPKGAGSAQTIGGKSHSGTRGTIEADTTAKNGLAATTSGSDGTHTHTAGTTSERSNPGASGGSGLRMWENPGPTTTQTTNTTNSGHGHTITVTGDAVTRPANICFNYIIKF